MMYVKTVYKGQTIEIELYGEEIFTKCSDCGKEIQVDEALLRDILADGGDMASTSVSCCPKPKLTRIK